MLVELYVDRLRHGSVATNGGASIVSDRGVAIVMYAGHEFRHLSAARAMGLAVERARLQGAGIVAVRSAFHFGAARRFALLAVEADCIGIAMCNTRPLMPAPGGAEPVVGNNPIAIAVPVDGPIPIVLDMATSEAAMGKIRLAHKAGRNIPAARAVKDDGTSTTDPGEAICGMLLPFGGPKGFGLAFLIPAPSEPRCVRCMAIQRCPTTARISSSAIDIAHFCEPAQFRAEAAKTAATVRAGRRAADVNRLFTPGEPEWRRAQESDGTVQLQDTVVRSLIRLGHDLGIADHPFAFALEEANNAQA
jgi:LDH2 family malate/lactate/ureidoglycolate dehydrogenase